MNNEFDPMFDAAGKFYNVDPQLLKTVFHVESAGNPNTAPGAAGETGGMQILPSTAQRLNVADPTDMKQAIPAAAKLLRQGLDANNGDPAAALRYYNGGAGGPMNGKTLPYVAKAMNLYPNMGLVAAQAPSQPPASRTSDERMGNDIIQQSLSGKLPAAQGVRNSGMNADERAGDTLIQQSIAPAQPVQSAPTTGAPIAGPAKPTVGVNAIIPDLTANPQVEALRNALQPGPNDYQFGGLGRLLPIAHDEVTHENRLAVPQAVQQLGTGVLDLLQGPHTGTVTPLGTQALTNLVLGTSGRLPASPVSRPAASLPIPNADPNSAQTAQFAELVRNALQQHGTQYFANALQGAALGHILGGPTYGAIGSLAAPFVAHLAPKVAKAVISRLSLSGLASGMAEQGLTGGSANALQQPSDMIPSR